MLKVVFDRGTAFLILILFSPLLVLVGLLVRFILGAPVFYCHRRPGLHAKPFCLYKFRTMTNRKDVNGNLLPDAERLVPFGRFLRSTSLDELPELINVLKGDMSLVGPRPLLTEYLPYYTEEEKIRHLVRPGITGWAQVNGRNTVTWDERLAMDVWYVKNMSFVLDIKILCMTVKKVLLRDGIVVIPGAIMQNLNNERNEAKK